MQVLIYSYMDCKMSILVTETGSKLFFNLKLNKTKYNFKQSVIYMTRNFISEVSTFCSPSTPAKRVSYKFIIEVLLTTNSL